MLIELTFFGGIIGFAKTHFGSLRWERKIGEWMVAQSKFVTAERRGEGGGEKEGR